MPSPVNPADSSSAQDMFDAVTQNTFRLERARLTPWINPTSEDTAVFMELRSNADPSELWPRIYMGWHHAGGRLAKAGDLRLVSWRLRTHDDIVFALVRDYHDYLRRLEALEDCHDQAIATDASFAPSAAAAVELCLHLAMDLSDLVDHTDPTQSLSDPQTDPLVVLPLIAWLHHLITALDVDEPSDWYFADDFAADLADL